MTGPGNWKMGNRELEMRNWKLEIGNGKSGIQAGPKKNLARFACAIRGQGLMGQGMVDALRHDYKTSSLG